MFVLVRGKSRTFRRSAASGPRTDYKCCTMCVMIGPWYHDPSLFSFFLLTLFGVSCRDNIFLVVTTWRAWKTNSRNPCFVAKRSIFGLTPHSVTVTKEGSYGFPTKNVEIILVLTATGWGVVPRSTNLGELTVRTCFVKWSLWGLLPWKANSSPRKKWDA